MEDEGENNIEENTEEMHGDNYLDRRIFAIQKSTRTRFSWWQKTNEKLRLRFKWYYNFRINPEYRYQNADDLLIAIQRSTKTTFGFLQPLHEKIRLRSKRYYNWHLNPYASKIHWVTLGLYTSLIIVGVFWSMFLGPYKPAHAANACASNATPGNWSAAGTWTSCGGTTPQSGDSVTITAGHTITVDSTQDIGAGTLTVNGVLNQSAALTAGDTTINNASTISTGNNALTVGSMTINTGGTLTAGTGNTISVSGSWTHVGTFTYNTSTVDLTGSGDVTTKQWTNDFYNLIVAHTGQTTTWATASGATITHKLTLAGDDTGHLTKVTESYIYISATGSDVIASSGATATGGIDFIFTGNGAVTIPAGTFYNNVGVNLAGTNTLTLGGNIQTAGWFRVYASGTGATYATIDTAGYDVTVGTSLIVGYSSSTANKGKIVNSSASTTSNISALYVTIYASDASGGVHNVLDASGTRGINISTTGTSAVVWVNSDTFTAGTNTVTFASTNTGHTINAGSSHFYNVTFNGSGGAWSPLTNKMYIDGDLTMTAGTFNTTTGTADVEVVGNIACGASTCGTIDMTTAGTNTFTQNVASNKNFGTSVAGTTAWAFYNLTFSSSTGTPTITTSTTATGTITVAQTLTISANTTLNAGNRSWILTGAIASPFSNSGTLTPATSTFQYKNVNAGGNVNVTTTSYNNLQFTPASAESYDMGGSFTAGNAMTGNLTIDPRATLNAYVGTTSYDMTMVNVTINKQGFSTNGTLYAGTNDSVGTSIFSVAGNWLANGIFTHGTSTVIFTAADIGHTITDNVGPLNFYNVTFNGSGGAWSPKVDVGAMTINNNLTMTAGTFDTSNGTANVTVNGTVAGTAGIINMTTTNTFTNRVAAAKNFGTTTGSTNWTFNNLNFENSSAGNLTVTTPGTATGQIIVGGTLTVGNASDTNTTTLDNETNDRIIDAALVTITSKGVLSASSTALFTVSDNWANSGTFTANSGTVTFDRGATTQTLNSGGTGAGQTFYNLTHSGAGTLQLATNALKITGTLANSNGTFDANDLNVNVAGDFNISGGSFSPDVSPGATTQTVTLDGAGASTQNVSGSTTFYKFTAQAAAARTIKFAAGTTTTVTNTLDVDGAAGQLLTLNSITDGTYWNFNVSSASPAVTYVAVKDSNASGGNQIAATNSTNSGHNLNWTFGATITIGGSCKAFDESTNCPNSEVVKVAVNGSLLPQTTTTGSGAWTITGIGELSTSDIITVFIDNVANANEANAVTKYDGSGNITGVLLYEDHLTIGSADNQTITNANLSSYDNSVSTDEDIFFEVDANNDLNTDATSQTAQDKIYIVASNTYRPDSASSGNVTTVNITIAGTVTADGNAFTIAGNWLNNNVFTAGASTVTFTSTASGKTINPGASSFYNLTFNGSGGEWSPLTNQVTVTNDLTMTAGTFNTAAGTANVEVNGNVACGVSCGTISMTSTNTFTQNVASNKNFGTSVAGTTAWTFNNLTFNDSGGMANLITTSTAATGDITINGILTLSGATSFNAGNRVWRLTSSGVPFVDYDGFNAGTSTISYESTSGATISSLTSGAYISIAYYNLQTNPSSGTPTYSIPSTPASFLAGTKVLTRDGQKNIEDIKVGETVKTYDLAKNQPAFSEVTGTTHKTRGEYYLINHKVRATGNHIFILSDGSGRAVETLKIGDELKTDTGTEYIESIENIKDQVDVYDLEVAQYHLFYAEGYLVHNAGDENAGPIISNNFTLTGAGSAIVDAETGDPVISVGGNFSIGANQTYSASSTGSFTIAGNFTNAGTFTANSGTVTLNGTTAQTITTNSQSFYNLTLNNTGTNGTANDDIIPADALDVNGTFTITDGQLRLDTNDPNVTVAGNLTIASAGSWTKQDGGTPTNTFDGLTAATYTDSNTTAQNLGIVVLNKTDTVAPATNNKLTVNSNMTVDSMLVDGTLLSYDTLAMGGAYTLTLAGAVATPFTTNTNGIFSPSTGTVKYTSVYVSGNVNIATLPYNSLQFTPASAETYDMTGNLNSANALTGNLTIDANATVDTINGTGYAINLAGNWTNSGTFTARTGTVTFTGTATGKTINTGGTGTGYDFYNLTFNGSGGAWSPLTNTVTITNDLTMTAGTFNTATGTANVTVNGTVAGTAGIINMTSTNTFTHRIGSAKNFGTTSGSTNWTFYNLNFENSSAGNLTVTTPGTATGQIIVGATLTIGNAGDSNTTTLDNNTNDRILDVNGDVSITAKGGLTASSSASFTVFGNWTNAGTFTHSNGTVTFDGTTTGHTINTGGTGTGKDFYNLTFNGSGGAWSPLTNQVTVANDLTMTAGTFDTSNGTANVVVSGNVACGASCGTIDMTTAGTNTFTQNVAAAKAFGTSVAGTTAWTFYNLTFTKSAGTPTITTSTTGTGDITVNNVLNIATSTTFNAGNRTYHLMGTGKPFISNGTFTYNTSTMSYENTTSATISGGCIAGGSPGVQYYNLQTNPASGTPTYTLATTATSFLAGTKVSTDTGEVNIEDIKTGDTVKSYDFEKNQSVFAKVTDTIQGTKDGYYIINNKVKATANHVFILSDNSQKTVEELKIGDTLKTGSGQETIKTLDYISQEVTVYDIEVGNYHLFYAEDYLVHNFCTNVGQAVSHDFTIKNGGGNATVDAETNDPKLDVNGNFSIEANQTFSASSTSFVYLAGNFTNAGTFTANTGTVTFDGTATGKTINPGASSFYNLTFGGGSGTWSPLTNTVTITNNLTMTSGTFDTSNGTANVVVNGTVAGTSGVINMTTTNTFTHRIGATKNFGTTSGSINWTFYNLNFENSSAGNLTVTTAAVATGQIITSGTLTIGNATDTNTTTLDNETNDRIIDSSLVTITSKGVLSASSTALFTVSDNWANSGTFTANSGTVTFDRGDTTQTLNSAGSYFKNLTHSGAGTLQLATSAIVISGIFTNSAGTFDANGLNMNVADDFLISGGSFSAGATPGTQTVTFYDVNEATISGSTTFNNLVMNVAPYGKTIKFTAGTTQTISSGKTWSLIGGEEGGELFLRSTVDESPWYFNISTPFTSGDYIDVMDSYSANANKITPGANITNSGNNLGWNFGITLSVDYPTLTFGSLIPGDVFTGYTETTVTINYLSGYSLSISDSIAGSDSALLHTDASTRIIDYAGTFTTPTSWTTGYGLGVCPYLANGKDTTKWGTGSSPTDSLNKYAGVPQTDAILFTNTSTTITNDTARIGYKLVVPNTQKTGNYTGDVLYTATALVP